MKLTYKTITVYISRQLVNAIALAIQTRGGFHQPMLDSGRSSEKNAGSSGKSTDYDDISEYQRPVDSIVLQRGYPVFARFQ